MKLYDPAVDPARTSPPSGALGAAPGDRGHGPPSDDATSARPRSPAAAAERHRPAVARPPPRRGRAALQRSPSGRGGRGARSAVLEHPARQHRPRAGPGPGLRRRPGRDRRLSTSGRTVPGRRRSRSTAISPTTAGSRSAGTSCPSTPPTARRSASSTRRPTIELAFPAPYLLHAPTDLRVVQLDDRRRGDQDDAHVWTSTREAFEEELLAFQRWSWTGAAAGGGLARAGRTSSPASGSSPAVRRRSAAGRIGGPRPPASTEPRRSSTWSRTPTGTASGTSRSRCSGCGWST